MFMGNCNDIGNVFSLKENQDMKSYKHMYDLIKRKKKKKTCAVSLTSLNNYRKKPERKLKNANPVISGWWAWEWWRRFQSFCPLSLFPSL